MKINEKVLAKTIARCKERGIIIPTFAQQKDPSKVPQKIKDKLKTIGLQDTHPLNLFRITWKNNPKENGGDGLYGDVNYLEIPSAISGVKARIVGIVGKWFPTGAHKVGAAFGCLAPRLVTGNFDPATQKAVWPSTGNYCRGGAFDCALLACDAIAILPQEMSKERFEWLKEIGASEIFATPGCESNVKEIYDKCHELRKERGDKIVIFNQFDEFGNTMWHYEVTASAMEEVFNKIKGARGRFSAYVSATGSAGTIGAGEYLKKKFPTMKIAATEALQCPTLYLNGFGGHRIEGIGDKHVPWVHNVRNTDNVVAIDDEFTMRVLRLFNEEAGKKRLQKAGVSKAVVEKLQLLGISSICNLIASIKMAKYYEMNENDVIFTVFTDSAAMYLSRLDELTKERGQYTEENAAIDIEHCLGGVGIDWLKELSYQDRKAIHNLKYFTWVEQQGKTVEEINALWEPEFWDKIFTQIPEWDRLIEEFNKKTGLA
ncbi:MAG: pyridoxal-5-phosphate-dependent protein subunit beta [Elusimicrobia bacterium HGW-Elusimicrobia-1]|jgi:cysteine synthase|nr:MAG: pyridoxal-5-phosphate-dependent protein subunit beta [Elusimicrobia bacterium HGW-Elusimicrobia-1]